MNATTVVSNVVEIDAPASQVWAIMVDFERYSDWNPFTFRVETTLELGAPVVLHLPDPAKPGESFTTLEQISEIVPNEHLQYNTGDSIPGVHAVRDQWVRSTGEHSCTYQTTDVFTGEFAQVAFDLQGEWVTNGFNATAHALKEHAEKLWAQQTQTDVLL